MNDLDRIVRELVTANRILANEDVVDACGHVSHRHPDGPAQRGLQASFARDPTRLGVLGTARWLRRHAGLVGP